MKIRVRRTATAEWHGAVEGGLGRIATASGALNSPYSLASRVGSEPATNPEELIAAAHAGCFAMSLANLIDEHGYTSAAVSATATVLLEELDSGFSITSIHLQAVGQADEMDEKTFRALATEAKRTCPVSRALAGTQIKVEAQLQQPRIAAHSDSAADRGQQREDSDVH